MLYYDRIDVFEGIDVDKTSVSKKCDICHCWYFLGKGFTWCIGDDRCPDVLMMSINLSDIAILNIHGADYQCIISGTTKK